MPTPSTIAYDLQRVAVSPKIAVDICAALIGRNIWFAVTPLPFEHYGIEVRREHSPTLQRVKIVVERESA